MSHDQLTIFINKATKQYLIEGRNQVEGMTVALASLFKGDVLQEYMSETKDMIDGLEGQVAHKVPPRPLKKQAEGAHQQKVNKSMQNLGQLTALFQGSWQPPP